MSITTEINRIKTAKQNLMTAINAKGGSLTENSKLEDFVTSVEEDIQTGGGIDYSAWSGTSFAYSTFTLVPIEIQAYLRTLTSLRKNFFYECSNLTSITIPSGITGFGAFTFYNCSNLASITVPETLSSIGDSCFRGCSKLSSITIPETLTNIGKEAFHSCSSLSSITLPSSITTYPSGLFSNSGITSYVLPNGMTTVTGNLFNTCSKLASITIPDSVNRIEGYSFYRCTSLTSVIIPGAVNYIGNNTFDGSNKLEYVRIEATTPPLLINADAFNSTNNCPIYVPVESVDAYKAANKWSSLASRIQAIPTENE